MSNNIQIIKLDDCYRLDVKKMLQEFNSSADVQPNRVDSEFEEYMSVAQLEVFPKRLIQANRTRNFVDPFKKPFPSCPLDPERMRIVYIGRSYMRIKTFTPPIIYGGYFNHILNNIVWRKILENDMKNSRYGFTYF